MLLLNKLIKILYNYTTKETQNTSENTNEKANRKASKSFMPAPNLE
jgi:hypothetical protein